MDESGRRIANVRTTEMSGGALRKYMARAVGSDRYRDLLAYEAATCFCRGLPGAAGIVLRRVVYRRLLGAFGKNSTVFEGVILRCPKQIFIGDHSVIDHGVLFDVKSSKARVRIGDRCQITRGVAFETGYEGAVDIADGVYVGLYTVLNGQGGLTIGANTLIGGHCHLVAGNHVFEERNRPINEQGFISKGIVIEEDVWLGGGVSVLDGVSIGKGSVISAGAVVTRSVEPYSIMAGVPARLVRERS